MRTIHPFPARMAPDTVVSWLKNLDQSARVLDPMCGSGVVVRQSALLGRNAIGFDVDPLAVLMSRVWTRKAKNQKKIVETAARQIISSAKRRRNISHQSLPWLKNCEETIKFIEFWFAEPQRGDLAALAATIYLEKREVDKRTLEILCLSLSRIVVTKQYGASLAWDVSHSRPHKVKETNDFDVFEGFLRSATRLAEILDSESLPVAGKINTGDCRHLSSTKSASIDAVVTSPPYLNAIDYLRGHKLSLVWLGYTIPHLRQIRADSVGTERGRRGLSDNAVDLERRHKEIERLPARQRLIVHRYAQDASAFLREMKRVLKPQGRMVLVLGNSNVRGVPVETSKIFQDAAEDLGFELEEEVRRPLEAGRRYLPTNSASGALANRMNSEVLQAYRAPLRA